MHDFARERAESPKPKIRSRASSKARPGSRPGSRPHSPGSTDSEVDEPPQPRSRRGSVHSRAGSARSRKRSDSQTTTGSAVEVGREKKEKEKKGGWSVWSRSATKKDREQFASLRDNTDDDSDNSGPEGAPGTPAQVSKSSSLLSLGKWTKSQQNIASPRIPALGSRARGGEQDRQKVLRAVNDYLGSTDELSFRTGDEIVVIGEVIDGWMMGQLGDKKGIFPTVYTEPVSASSRRTVSTPPTVPTPPLLMRKSSSRADSDVTMDSPSGSRQTLVETDSAPPARPGFGGAEPAQAADTEDDDDASHPFGDHHATTTHGTTRERRAGPSLDGGYGYSYDSESLAESTADDSEHEHSRLVQRRASDDDGFVNYQRNNNNSNNSNGTGASGGPPKKAPPPLPRRQTDVRKAPPPPPPPRRPSTYVLRDGQTGDCVSFVQAVGRATGMCANCQRMHIE